MTLFRFLLLPGCRRWLEGQDAHEQLRQVAGVNFDDSGGGQVPTSSWF